MGTYWTVQRPAAWVTAQRDNVLRGHEQFASSDLVNEYRWMMEQMQKRLPSYDWGFPIWVWTERPDLRTSGFFERGTEAVLLKLSLDDSSVLVSDFDAWHVVLNDGFCAVNEEEWDAFYRGELSLTKEQSWERIFDLSLVRNNGWWDGDDPKTQGVVERVSLSAVLDVRPFIAR